MHVWLSRSGWRYASFRSNEIHEPADVRLHLDLIERERLDVSIGHGL
jgi:hypothetical protein